MTNSRPTGVSATSQGPIAFQYECVSRYGDPHRTKMSPKTDVWQGTLALMVLKTLETLGPLHGYGIARRIEQTSNHLLAINYGTLYPQLIKFEQEGSITAEWGVSENGRKAKFYRLTRAGRRQLAKATEDWEQVNTVLAKFLEPEESS